MEKLKKSKKQMLKIILTIITGTFGSSILSFIIGLLILKNTESAMNFGISQVIGPVVSLCLLPFVGAIIDKYKKRNVIIIAQLFSILSLSLYAFSLNKNSTYNLFNTYILLVCLKVADQFLSNAFSSSNKKVVCEEHIQKLKSFEQMISSSIYIISPIFAAFLLTKLSLVHFVILEIIFEFITILIVLFIDFNFMDTDEKLEEIKNQKILNMFKEGLKYVKNKKVLTFIIFFSMFLNFIFTIFSIGLPFVLIKELKMSDYYYGIINAIFPTATIISSIILSMLDDIKYPLEFSFRWIKVFFLILLFLGISLLFNFDKFSYFIVFSIFAFSTGFVLNFVNTPTGVWFTKTIPIEYQGRVFSLLETGCSCLMPLGILFYSIAFDNFKSGYIFIFAAIATLVVVFIPNLLNLDMKTDKL